MKRLRFVMFITCIATACVMFASGVNLAAKENKASGTELTDAKDGIAWVIVKGDVLPDSVRVRMIKWEEGHGEYVATDTVKNGQFKLSVPVKDGLTIGSIMFDYYAFPNLIHKLYLSPGVTVEIDATDQYMFTWPVKSSVPEQAEYELYIDNSKNLWIEYQLATIDFQKRGDIEVYSQKADSLKQLIYLRDLDLLKKRPVGTVWMNKAIDFAKCSHIATEEMNKLYSNLDDSIKNSPMGKELYGYLYPETSIGVGDKIPDIEFYELDGKAHRFSDFQGKWCLVDFWNSGCGPCLRAHPELRELSKKFPESLELISLSLDADTIWRKASEKLNLVGHNCNEGKKSYGIFRRLGLNAYPAFLVLSPDGTIKDIWRGYGTGELKQRMSFYLRPKGKTEYYASDGVRTILYPKYETNRTDRVLDIERIEISGEGTKIFFSFVYYPKYGISISPNAYLSDSNGSKYIAIGSEGIVLGEHLFADADGYGSFSITFEKVPESIETIDFHETSSQEGWSIEAISLKH